LSNFFKDYKEAFRKRKTERNQISNK
jgi:hypothetical protein